jgi:hypothetical protein
MNTIPEEFQINTLLNQDTYLVDGELKNGQVKPQQFFFDISSTAEYAPTIRFCSINGRSWSCWGRSISKHSI